MSSLLQLATRQIIKHTITDNTIVTLIPKNTSKVLLLSSVKTGSEIKKNKHLRSLFVSSVQVENVKHEIQSIFFSQKGKNTSNLE